MSLNETYNFFEMQLSLSPQQVVNNLNDFASEQITELLQKKKHYNLNHLQVQTVLHSPPHLLEITQEYICSLNRAILVYDYEEDPNKIDASELVELKFQYNHRSPVVTTIGLLRIETEQLENHIRYLREKDALYNSIFTSVLPIKYNQSDAFGFLKAKYLNNGIYNFPLIDSLIHHKVPASIVYISY